MQNQLSRLGGQLGVALCLIGFLAIFIGWNGAASHNFVAAQFPYLVSGGIAGLAVVVVGAAMIIVQNQRVDRARLEAVLSRIAASLEHQGMSSGSQSGLGSYVVAGTASYHQLDCPLPEARAEAHLVPLEDVRTSGLEACRVCRPPQFGRLSPAAATPVAP